MYLEHFSLKEKPFDMQPDIKFYCPCATHKHAEELIEYSINNNDSITKITGPIGTGKTLLIERIKQILPQKKIITLLNPSYSTHQVLSTILTQLPTHIKGQSNDPMATLEKALYLYAQDKKPVVIVIDEAQTAQPSTLEALRLYTNLRFDNQPILQLVLIGQPELNSLLQHPSMAQISQRINFSHTIKPLTLEEVRHYLHKRINLSGPQKRVFWERDSIDLIFNSSKGLPRTINKVAHKALMLAFFDRSHVVTKKHVARAAHDSEIVTIKSRPLGLITLTLSNVLLAAVATYIIVTG